MQSIETADAPRPAGHYSQAIVHNGFVFVAGQLPIVPGQTEHRPGHGAAANRADASERRGDP